MISKGKEGSRLYLAVILDMTGAGYLQTQSSGNWVECIPKDLAKALYVFRLRGTSAFALNTIAAARCTKFSAPNFY